MTDVWLNQSTLYSQLPQVISPKKLERKASFLQSFGDPCSWRWPAESLWTSSWHSFSQFIQFQPAAWKKKARVDSQNDFAVCQRMNFKWRPSFFSCFEYGCDVQDYCRQLSTIVDKQMGSQENLSHSGPNVFMLRNRWHLLQQQASCL